MPERHPLAVDRTNRDERRPGSTSLEPRRRCRPDRALGQASDSVPSAGERGKIGGRGSPEPCRPRPGPAGSTLACSVDLPTPDLEGDRDRISDAHRPSSLPNSGCSRERAATVPQSPAGRLHRVSSRLEAQAVIHLPRSEQSNSNGHRVQVRSRRRHPCRPSPLRSRCCPLRSPSPRSGSCRPRQCCRRRTVSENRTGTSRRPARCHMSPGCSIR